MCLSGGMVLVFAVKALSRLLNPPVGPSGRSFPPPVLGSPPHFLLLYPLKSHPHHPPQSCLRCSKVHSLICSFFFLFS